MEKEVFYMPEWMLKKDNFMPQKDKDAFIDKSILSIMSVIARLHMQPVFLSKILTVNTLIKVLSALLIILLTALAKNFAFVLVINVYILILISLFNAEQIKYILKAGVAAAVFTIMIFIPSMLYGNSSNGVMIILKVFASVSAVSIVSFTSSLNEVLSVLKFFFIPDIFIFVFDITIKYIDVLGDFALNGLYALKKRSVGRSKHKSSSLSGIMGTMFIKSKEMSEELYGAMECRGFTGEYKLPGKFEFHISDYICIMIDIVFVIIYFYFDRL